MTMNGWPPPSSHIHARHAERAPSPMAEPAVWLPAVRTGTGTDHFTRTLCDGLRLKGLRAEITWIDRRAEYFPWTVPIQRAPSWANIVHINTWLHSRFYKGSLPIVATSHHCVHTGISGKRRGIARTAYHRIWIERVERAALQRATNVIAVSQFTANQTKAHFGPVELSVIHNGVDTSIFRPATDKADQASPFKILYIGSFSTRKGSDLLAPIMQQLGPDFQLRHSGNRDQAAKWRLTDDSIALGRLNQAELVRELQQADILLFPSRLEGFGLAVAESMACGTPVVASHASSLPEIISDESDGLLCRTGDAAQFAASIRRLADNRAFLDELSTRAATKIGQHFSLERFIDAHINLYLETLR